MFTMPVNVKLDVPAGHDSSAPFQGAIATGKQLKSFWHALSRAAFENVDVTDVSRAIGSIEPSESA